MPSGIMPATMQCMIWVFLINYFFFFPHLSRADIWRVHGGRGCCGVEIGLEISFEIAGAPRIVTAPLAPTLDACCCGTGCIVQLTILYIIVPCCNKEQLIVGTFSVWCLVLLYDFQTDIFSSLHSQKLGNLGWRRLLGNTSRSIRQLWEVGTHESHEQISLWITVQSLLLPKLNKKLYYFVLWYLVSALNLWNYEGKSVYFISMCWIYISLP